MGFYIQDDFWEACSELPQKSQDEIFGAMVRFYFTGEEPNLKGVSKAMFVSFRKRVLLAKDAAKRKQKSRETEQDKECDSHNECHRECHEEHHVTDLCPSFLESERESKSKSKREKNKGGRFAPPTPEQVAQYAEEKDLNVDAQRFCDFYASKGWKVGSSPMKDWKAAARNWSSRNDKGVKRDAEYELYASLV